MPLALKAQCTVTAGVIPGEMMSDHTRVWSYTGLDYVADQAIPADQPTRFSKMLDEAHAYAKGLSNPAYLNWVKTIWMWM